MKALKIILVVVAVLVICVVLLGLYGQLEDRRRDTAWVQKENAEKSEEQKFLPTIELFDLGLGDANSTGEDQFWFREVHGRVRNKSPKSLYSLAIKISILDSSGALIDTYSASVNEVAAAPGDVKSFSTVVDIQRVPKGFKWQCQLTGISFYKE